MSNTQQPEALRLAHTLSGGKLIDDSTEWADTLHAAAAELRRQHARIEELEEQLSAIGAGGVEPLRKPASVAAHDDERKAFEKWLRIKPCGAAHDFGWEAWRARAALNAAPEDVIRARTT